MLNHNAQIKTKTNLLFFNNNEFSKKKQVEDIYNYKNKKESNNAFSPNIIEISSLNQYKESIDPLVSDDNSDFSPLIYGSTIKNMISLEEREEDENENTNNMKKRVDNNNSISKFIVKKINKKQIFKVKKILKLGRIKKFLIKKESMTNFKKIMS